MSNVHRAGLLTVMAALSLVTLDGALVAQVGPQSLSHRRRVGQASGGEADGGRWRCNDRPRR